MPNLKVGLIGAPNVGKSTLFNFLTGQHNRIGNFAGVTVECHHAQFHIGDQAIHLIDCPGVSHLSMRDDIRSRDQRLSIDLLHQGQMDAFIQVIDASHLENGLYLTTELLETGIPFMIVLSMMDVVDKHGEQIDVESLAKQIGVPVVALRPKDTKRKSAILDTLKDILASRKIPKPILMPASVERIRDMLAKEFQDQPPIKASARALWILSEEHQQESPNLRALRANFLAQEQESIDVIIADSRYKTIAKWLNSKSYRSIRYPWTKALDAMLLNRWFAFPIFFLMMYLMFVFAINGGKVFQDAIDIMSEAIFIDGFAQVLQFIECPNWLVALLAQGAGRGIHTTLSFVPVLMLMFLFLSFLESSGYMARGAFVMDKLMQKIGLPGQSFVPLIIGFGCNVPGILATRSLKSDKERTLTILMSPFMSCSARLAVYSVFVSAFFPSGGHNVVFSLYFIGIFFALLTGFVFRKLLAPMDATTLLSQIPDYKWPSLRLLWLQTWVRLKAFLWRAGKIIVPACVVIGMLNAITVSGDYQVGDEQSLLALLGRLLTPLFYPMGIEADNWPATVGLLTGSVAKEVVIGTLNTLYSQLHDPKWMQTAAWADVSIWGAIEEAFGSIWTNVKALPSALINPLWANAQIDELSHGVYGEMSQRFHNAYAAYSYLLFVLLYVPCVSTLAVIARELNQKMMWYSLTWSTFVAYSVSVLFYQLATFGLHPLTSGVWVTLIVSLWGMLAIWFTYQIKHPFKTVFN